MKVYILIGPEGCWEDTEQEIKGVYSSEKLALKNKQFDDHIEMWEVK
jgi:16S rRNA U1498 N3-methylase RsmE